MIKVYLLVELHRATVEIGEEIGLIVVGLLDAGQSVNNGLWVNFFLNVKGNHGGSEVFAVLFLPSPSRPTADRGIGRVGEILVWEHVLRRPRSRATPRSGCWRACSYGESIRFS